MMLEELIAKCQAEGLTFELAYDNGKYVEARDAFDDLNHLLPEEQIPPDKVKQGPTGFTISVAGHYFGYTEGNEQLFPDLATTLKAGEVLLAQSTRVRRAKAARSLES